MPSGYTEEIAKGISFKTFALRCARAFGALAAMRDDPYDAEIPDEFKPSDYEIKALESAMKMLEEAEGVTLEEARINAYESYINKLSEHKNLLKKADDLKDKYTEMLQKVDEWQPPTPEHRGLKDFMRDQILKSIQNDCNKSYYLSNPPKLSTPEEWINETIGRCLKGVSYHTDELRKEILICAERTAWVVALKKSLKEESS